MGIFTKKFSEEEEYAILSLFTTNPNPDANIFGIWPGMLSEEQTSLLGASYSRTHEPFKKRLLHAIESKDIVVPVVDEFLSQIKEFRKGSIGEIAKKFVEKWAHGFGHNSPKELAKVCYCTENIPVLTANVIHANPLTSPLVKSSRYLDWSSSLDFIKENKDIQYSKHKDLYIQIAELITTSYKKIIRILTKHIANDSTSQEFLEHILSFAENLDEKDQLKKQFIESSERTGYDSARYLALLSMPTSQMVVESSRSNEYSISDLLSSPLLEDRLTGEEIWKENRKLVPILLGDKCHANKNQYEIKTREKLDELVTEIFPFEKNKDYKIHARTYKIPDEASASSDLQVASALSFKHGHASYTQYYTYLKENPQLVSKIIKTALSERGLFDEFPKAYRHHGLTHETTFDKGAQRDKRRHRRGIWTEQVHTAELGYEIPKIIEESDARDIYVNAMNEVEKTYKTVAKENKYIAQLIVPFGFRSRTLFSWSPQQNAYYIELRSKPTGHISYREDAFALCDFMKTQMPISAEYIRVNNKTYPPAFVNLSDTKLKRNNETVTKFDSRKWYDEVKRK